LPTPFLLVVGRQLSDSGQPGAAGGWEEGAGWLLVAVGVA